MHDVLTLECFFVHGENYLDNFTLIISAIVKCYDVYGYIYFGYL